MTSKQKQVAVAFAVLGGLWLLADPRRLPATRGYYPYMGRAGGAGPGQTGAGGRGPGQ